MFTMRSAAADPGVRVGSYAAMLDTGAWGETGGCLAAILSEHHGAEDRYLPSPMPVAAAIVARTSSLPTMVATLVLPFYEPVKPAEDLAVIDLVSRGRVAYVIGLGYRDEEFAMFGVDRRARAGLAEERSGVLRRRCAGGPFTVSSPGIPARRGPNSAAASAGAAT